MTAAAAPLSRRGFLVGGLAVAGVAAAGPLPSAAARVTPQRRLGDPFTLGIASGDPAPDGFVLWTRLAVAPLAADGRGGMPARTLPVRWQLATDPRFRRVVRRGVALARPEAAHSVHVEVAGLEPDREYWYRFRVGGHLSRRGHTRTAPANSSPGSPLHLAVASCAQYEHGHFTAYRRLAQDRPDLVVHLGDYVYEYKAGYSVSPEGNVRDFAGPETVTLANYRQRHAQYKTDPDLQAAHAVAPWVVVWDDHEVDNNWADDVPERPDPDFRTRRAAAFRAYYENMPLRRTSVPRGADLQLFRRLRWGRLATFHLLDTRQYRSDQACGDGPRVDCDERLDPARSITGAAQEAWLLDGLDRSRTTWDLLGQQVFFAPLDIAAGSMERYTMDSWDGYAANRQRIIAGMAGTDTNPVVLTGDAHRHYANDIKTDVADPSSRTVGVELVTSSVTSGGDGRDRTPETDVQLAENAHVRFANSQRGYLWARLDHQTLRADFRVLDYVSRPGSPARTRQSFVVESGRPGLQPV